MSSDRPPQMEPDEVAIGQLRTESARRMVRENQYPSVERLARIEDDARDIEHAIMERAMRQADEQR